MLKVDFAEVIRVVCSFFCGLGAILILWRGHTYGQGTPYVAFSLVVPVMCALMGVILALTGYAIAFRLGKSDAFGMDGLREL